MMMRILIYTILILFSFCAKSQIITVHELPDSIFVGSIGNVMLDMTVDNNNEIWLATEGGLSKLNENYEVVEYYSEVNSDLPHFYTQALAVDTFNQIWIGSAGGVLAEFDGNSNWTNHSPYYDVTGIKVNKANHIWFHGWTNGIAQYDRTAFNWYNTQNSDIPSDYIYDVEIQNDSTIWIATIDKGIAKFSEGIFTVYDTLNSNIASNVVYGLEIDSNNIVYCGTDKGMCYYDGEQWHIMETLNHDYCIEKCQPLFVDSKGFLWVTINHIANRNFLRIKEDNRFLLDEIYFHPDFVYNTPIVEISSDRFITYSNNSTSIIEIDFNTSINKLDVSDELHVFPIPSSNKIFIKSDFKEMTRVEFYSLKGMKLMEFKLNSLLDFKGDVSAFSSGIYVVKVTFSDDSEAFKKIFKY